MNVRLAEEKDLSRVNELRKQVNDVHVMGKPEVFKAGFSSELRDYIQLIRKDPEQEIVVAEKDGTICAFAVIHHISRPENPFMYERDFLDIDEFCVDENIAGRVPAARWSALFVTLRKKRAFIGLN